MSYIWCVYVSSLSVLLAVGLLSFDILKLVPRHFCFPFAKIWFMFTVVMPLSYWQIIYSYRLATYIRTSNKDRTDLKLAISGATLGNANNFREAGKWNLQGLMNSRFHEATKHEDEEEIDVDAVDIVRIKPICIYFALLPMIPAVLVPVLQLLLSIGCFLKLNTTFPEAPEYDTGCVILTQQDYSSSYCYADGSFIMGLDQATFKFFGLVSALFELINIVILGSSITLSVKRMIRDGYHQRGLVVVAHLVSLLMITFICVLLNVTISILLSTRFLTVAVLVFEVLFIPLVMLFFFERTNAKRKMDIWVKRRLTDFLQKYDAKANGYVPFFLQRVTNTMHLDPVQKSVHDYIDKDLVSRFLMFQSDVENPRPWRLSGTAYGVRMIFGKFDGKPIFWSSNWTEKKIDNMSMTKKKKFIRNHYVIKKKLSKYIFKVSLP